MNIPFRSARLEVTPDQLAQVTLRVASQLATEGDTSVRSMLQRAGALSAVDDVRFRAEAIVYQLFLLSVILDRTFGKETDRIRKRLLKRFAELGERIARRSGEDPASPYDFEELLENRFEEYRTALWRSTSDSHISRRVALPLEEVACRRLTGTEETNPLARAALGAQWPLLLEHYAGAFRPYKIVGSGNRPETRRHSGCCSSR